MGMTESSSVPVYSRQLQLPIFPSDAVSLGSHHSVVQRDDQVWYFLYDMPVFSHGVDDIASFRMYTSSLCDQGHCKLVEVERAFNVSAISVNNESEAVARYLCAQAAINEEVAQLLKGREQLLKERKAIPQHIKLSEMPEDQRPKLISHTRRQFLNTIRRTAYRAETALVAFIRQHLKRSDDARALAKALFTHDADLIFEPDSRTLTVRLHHFINPLSSKAISSVLEKLNHAEIEFPASNIKMKYEMVSEQNPTSQDL